LAQHYWLQLLQLIDQLPQIANPHKGQVG